MLYGFEVMDIKKINNMQSMQSPSNMMGGVPSLSQPSAKKTGNSQIKPALKVPLLNLGGQNESNKKDLFSIEKDQSMNAGRQ